MTYGCKIMVSLTLYGFLDHPVVFHDKISCCWMRGGPLEQGGKRGAPFKRRYFTVIGSSSLKMVADRHRNALATSFLELSTLITLIDLEP